MAISIGEGDDETVKDAADKDHLIWMTESTVISNADQVEQEKAAKNLAAVQASTISLKGKRENKQKSPVFMLSDPVV